MAKNIIRSMGKTRALPVPAGIKAGDPVAVGNFVGVALTDRAVIDVDPFIQVTGLPNPAYNMGGGNAHGEATIAREAEAVFQDIAFAVAEIGLPIYITPANALTLTASGNKLFGLSYSTKAAAAGPLTVVIG